MDGSGDHARTTAQAVGGPGPIGAQPMDEDFIEVAVVDVDVGSARAYEEGWQS
jgi:hypothetical protein